MFTLAIKTHFNPSCRRNDDIFRSKHLENGTTLYVVYDLPKLHIHWTLTGNSSAINMIKFDFLPLPWRFSWPARGSIFYPVAHFVSAILSQIAPFRKGDRYSLSVPCSPTKKHFIHNTGTMAFLIYWPPSNCCSVVGCIVRVFMSIAAPIAPLRDPVSKRKLTNRKIWA